MKSSNIGGQAVLEGIMMKNKTRYAVAVRKPDQQIEVCVKEYKGIIPWQGVYKVPFIRGIFNFIDSLVLGMKTLTYSASFFEEEEGEVLTEQEAQKQEKQLYFVQRGTYCAGRCDPNGSLSFVYWFDLQNEGYSEDIYVSWGRAQVYQLY